MKKLLTFVAVVLAVLVIPVRSVAQRADEELTGADLYKKCQSAITNANSEQTAPPKAIDHGGATYCMAYLLGMRDMLTVWNLVNKADNHNELSIACAPREPSVHELTKLVIKYLDDHPTELHHAQSIVVTKAFQSA